jgi:putative Ca2+/H+ antiporter (TMEM165/GDT1 family)
VTTPLQIPKVYTHYAATALFFFFGFKTLWDAYHHEEVRGRHAGRTAM